MSDVPESVDLCVVGAGAAGLAAATMGAALGLSTLLVDEQPAPGGQIYRAATTTPLARSDILGAEYGRGAELAAAFAASGAGYLSGTAVWTVTPAGAVGIVRDGAARMIAARRVVIATGALERPFPIPGWTLPGVITCGAGQILLKTSGLVPEGGFVIAGSGPLVWLVAAQYLRAGATPLALLDTTPAGNLRRALPHLPGFLLSPYAAKGLALVREVRRRVRIVRRVERFAAHGDGRLAEIVVAHGGREERIRTGTLLLHQGVVPNVNLAAASGCTLAWDETRLAFAPVVDAWGASSVETIAVAGDGAGIAGAEAAEERGRLAALDAAFRLGRIDRAGREREAAAVFIRLAEAERGRRFLDTLWRPADRFRIPEGDTIVCRCEEVTAAEIVAAARLGVPGPNQMKAFLRAGMGPCQGRLCGLTVTELVARHRGRSPAEIGHYRLRPPVKPLSLGALASLPLGEAARLAVDRD